MIRICGCCVVGSAPGLLITAAGAYIALMFVDGSTEFCQ